jgi:hypothetical protein
VSQSVREIGEGTVLADLIDVFDRYRQRLIESYRDADQVSVVTDEVDDGCVVAGGRDGT